MSTNMDPKTYCLRRTAIAAVRTSIGEKTFWQDFDGQIRETRYEYGKGYSGGDVGSIIADAKDTKYQGPLAAFSTEDPANAITLFYISTASTLRSTTFSSLTSTWSPTSPLSALNISACPASSLAVTCYGGKSGGANIRLFYQDPSLKLRELAYGDDGNNWRHVAGFELPALVGTSLASDKWMNDDGTLREIQFFYQDSTCEVRSHFYLAADDTWYWGYLHLPSRPPQCGLAASAHRHLGYGGDVCRVFVVDHGGKIVEHAYHDAEGNWKVTELAPQLLEESKLAACWWPNGANPDIRLFYQGIRGDLQGYNFQNREWHHEHTLPCGGTRGAAKL